MAVYSTKGLKVYITKGDAVPVSVEPTAIALARPASVTVDGAEIVNVHNGDVAKAVTTGFSELDGKAFVAGNVGDVTDTFNMLGSNTTGSTGTLDASPEIEIIDQTQMVNLCLSALDLSPGTPGEVSIGTFCDPSASVPGNVTAGTVSLSGYVDIDSTGYAELLLAEEDAIERYLTVAIPNSGYLMAPLTISSISWDIPLEGAVGFSASATLGSSMKHYF